MINVNVVRPTLPEIDDGGSGELYFLRNYLTDLNQIQLKNQVLFGVKITNQV